MLWLHACPRCAGDLMEEQGYRGEVWISCLQCGAVLTGEDEAALRAPGRTLREPVSAA
ncbi:MAG: hypothetical protein HY691_11695 [Chloroflexi bacterium]|nr:hypothetical protein [Chloroflexota bacterium]